MNLEKQRTTTEEINLTLYQKRKDNQQKEINEQTTTTMDKSKSVINLSTYNITEYERKLLENGMNFSVTPQNRNNINRNDNRGS